jgi:hypothetical protein
LDAVAVLPPRTDEIMLWLCLDNDNNETFPAD